MNRLSSTTDSKYDEQTFFKSPRPQGSSSKGYQNTINEAVVGFIGGLRRGSHSHRPGRNDSERRNGNERQNDNRGTKTPSYYLSRDNLRDIAISTLQTLDEGEYFPPGQDGPYDLEAKILWSEKNTRYYGPGAGRGGKILESEFIKINEEGGDEVEEEKVEERNKDGNDTGAGEEESVEDWYKDGKDTDAGEEANDASYLNDTKQGENESEMAEAAAAAAASKPLDDDNANPKDHTRIQATVSPDPPKKAKNTGIFIGEYSTLIGARKVHLALAANTDPSTNKKIGVLNFASAKQPGGGFIIGSQAQEESIARASTLYASLVTDTASQFYTHYAEDPGNAYYTHAMVYSPGIVLIRDDKGEWRSPVEVDVLTSAAVNAAEIRRDLEREERLRRERVEMENWKRKGEERRKELEKAMAERQQRVREAARIKKEREIAKLKEQANLLKLQEELTSYSTIVHPLPPSTQPSQASDPDPKSTYTLVLENAEVQIRQTMYVRISRILHLFQLHQTPHLILGSFGTGVLKNRIDMIASIFADLLIKPGGRFKDVFETVVFAILGKETVRVFTKVFSIYDKRAQREGTGMRCVFVDGGSDGDVKEGDEERSTRMMRWNERRKRNALMYAVPEAAAPSDPT